MDMKNYLQFKDHREDLRRFGGLDRADEKERARKIVANLQGRSCRSGREDASREGPATRGVARIWI